MELGTGPTNSPLPPADEPEVMANLLLYGTAEARRHLAEDLGRRDDRAALELLVATVRSTEPWLLRARCLEVVGLVAASVGRGIAEAILADLCGAGTPPEPAPE